MTKFKIIDSHHHLWRLSRGDYRWLTPELSTLYRDFEVSDYRQVASPNVVSASVLVQAADSDDETDFMLQQANDNDVIAGVVGWVDMTAPSDDVCQRLEHLATHSKFKGIRPMLQDIEDVDWILTPDFAAIFDCLSELKLTFDALVKIEHLANIHVLASQYPDLKIVIDHCAKPDIANNMFDNWASQIAVFAPLKNVYIKWSGLPTEASTTQNNAAGFQQYFDHVYRVFGANRMMWGSDWPVVNLNSNYADWLANSQQLTAGLSAQEQEAIWANTAIQFYQLSI